MSHSEIMENQQQDTLCPKCGNHLLFDHKITALVCSMRCGYQKYLNDVPVSTGTCKDCGGDIQVKNQGYRDYCDHCLRARDKVQKKRALQERKFERIEMLQLSLGI